MITEELSEEDQKLKEDLEMLVDRLLVSRLVCSLVWMVLTWLNKQESDTSLYKPTLEAIKTSIKTSTSSMTAVPKPLKFLRPHYANLEKAYESWPAGDHKARLA